MKISVILVLSALCLLSLSSFAAERTVRACIGDVTQFAPVKEYILVSETLADSGLVEEFEVSTTFGSYEDCRRAMQKQELEKPTLSGKESLNLNGKCYASSISPNLYHSVLEVRNPETGLVVDLMIENEYNDLLACLSGNK